MDAKLPKIHRYIQKYKKRIQGYRNTDVQCSGEWISWSKSCKWSGRRNTKNTKIQKYSAVQGRYLGPKAVSGSGRSGRKSSLLLLWWPFSIKLLLNLMISGKKIKKILRHAGKLKDNYTLHSGWKSSLLRLWWPFSKASTYDQEITHSGEKSNKYNQCSCASSDPRALDLLPKGKGQKERHHSNSRLGVAFKKNDFWQLGIAKGG